jgi:hypothetical protein
MSWLVVTSMHGGRTSEGAPGGSDKVGGSTMTRHSSQAACIGN